jgi:hypothetical protein
MVDEANTAEARSSQSLYAEVDLLGGYRWAWDNGVTLSAGLGGRFVDATSSSNLAGDLQSKLGPFKLELPRGDYRGLIPTAELAVGLII